MTIIAGVSSFETSRPPMQLSEFKFDLPSDLIAQVPPDVREGSRMLVVDRKNNSFEDRLFVEFPDLLNANDLLVINNTKVFPARLFGFSDTGAKIEIFLIEDLGDQKWLSLARPVRRLRPGKKVVFDEGLAAEILEILPEGKVIARYESDEQLDDIVQRIGKTPLPPYIRREGADIDTDRERYQTVYAKNRGAIAAPTAGLHFTKKTFDRIRDRGAEITEITLHVGYGTFEPVRVNELSEHKVSAERFEIPEIAADLMNNQRTTDNRIIVVGTTTTRALESSIAQNGVFRAGRSLAELTIIPSFKFKAVDGLLTNFHLPQSSLLVLVSTFGGHELIMKAYRHAVESRYRFYSYGDCMLII